MAKRKPSAIPMSLIAVFSALFIYLGYLNHQLEDPHRRVPYKPYMTPHVIEQIKHFDSLEAVRPAY